MFRILSLLSCLPVLSLSAQVWFDPAFGTNGVVGTSLNPAYDGAFVVERQVDGKLVVGGSAGTGANYDLIVARYNADGSLDTDFATEGVFTLDQSTNDRCYALAVHPDGRIIAGGTTGSPNVDMLIVQLTSDGELDDTFHTDGILTIDEHVSADAIYALAIQDNKILIAGRTFTNNKNAFYLSRLLPDGTVDSGFGNEGVTTHLIDDGNCEISAIELLPDGRIVCAGSSFTSEADKYDFAVARYSADGLLDETFSTDGKATFTLSTDNDRCYALALTQNGDLLLGGVQGEATNTSKFTVLRATDNGEPSASFGNAGVAYFFTGVLPTRCEELAETTDGRIYAAGTSAFDNSGRKGILCRMTADGSPDADFGTSGILEYGDVGQYRETPGMVLQPDGKVVVAGITGTAPNINVLLIRYLSSPITGIAEQEANGIQLLSATSSELRMELKTYTPIIQLCDAGGRLMHEGRVNLGTDQLVIRLRKPLTPGAYLLKAGASTLRFAIAE